MDENTQINEIREVSIITEEKKEFLTTPRAIVIGAGIVAAAIIVGSFVVGHGPFKRVSDPAGADSQQAVDTTGVPPNIKNVTIAGNPYIGKVDAPVVLAYWSDYQCPFCKQIETTTIPTVIKNYVETGKVKIVYKDFVFLGPDSLTAALYEHAVWDLYPDKFFAWREAMFAAQDKENGGFGDEASVVALTGTIPGVDATRVKAQVAQKKDAYQKEMDKDRDEGVKMGAKGTPSFVTGTTLIPGVVPYTSFSSAIDAQLK